MHLPSNGFLEENISLFWRENFTGEYRVQAETGQVEETCYFTTMKGYSRFVAGLLLDAKTRE